MAGNLKLAATLGAPAGWIRQAVPSRIFASAGLGLLALFALIVLTRRLLGTFSGSISPLGYLVCLLLASLACCSIKIAAEWPPYRLPWRTSLIFGTLLGLPLDVLAVALLPSQWTYVGLILLLGWISLVGWFCISRHSCVYARWLIREILWSEVERFLCPTGFRKKTVPDRPAATASPMPAETPRESMLSLARDPFPDDPAPDDEAGGLISRLQRRAGPAGGELLEGQLVAKFAAGSKQAVLHVPFTPPFSATPQVSCEITDGSDVRIKAAAVFTYGVRFELKRNTPELPELDVAVEIYAEAPSSEAPATVMMS